MAKMAVRNGTPTSKPTWKYRGVGKRIRSLRKALGISQRQLDRGNVSYAYISRIESGDRRPSLDALITIADALDTTALYLLAGDAHADCPVCKRSGGDYDDGHRTVTS